jgi:hypothetical protein
VRRIELKMGIEPSHYERGAPPKDSSADADGRAKRPADEQPTDEREAVQQL